MSKRTLAPSKLAQSIILLILAFLLCPTFGPSGSTQAEDSTQAIEEVVQRRFITAVDDALKAVDPERLEAQTAPQAGQSGSPTPLEPEGGWGRERIDEVGPSRSSPHPTDATAAGGQAGEPTDSVTGSRAGVVEKPATRGGRSTDESAKGVVRQNIVEALTTARDWILVEIDRREPQPQAEAMLPVPTLAGNSPHADDTTASDDAPIDFLFMRKLRYELAHQLIELKEGFDPKTRREFLEVTLELVAVLDLLGEKMEAVQRLESAEHAAHALQAEHPVLCLQFWATAVELDRRLGRHQRARSIGHILRPLIERSLKVGLDSSRGTASYIARLAITALDLHRECALPQGDSQERWYMECRQAARWIGSAPLHQRIKHGVGPGWEVIRARAADIDERINEVATQVARHSYENQTAALVELEARWSQLAKDVTAQFGPNTMPNLLASWRESGPNPGSILVSIHRVVRPWVADSRTHRPGSGDYFLAHVLTANGQVQVVDLGSAYTIDFLAKSWRVWTLRDGYKDPNRVMQYSYGDALRKRALDPVIDAVGQSHDGAPIFLSLDPSLVGTPLESLPTAGQVPTSSRMQTVGEVHTIRRIGKLVGATAPSVAASEAPNALIISDVSYGAWPGDASGTSGPDPLPGSIEEARAIAQIASQTPRVTASHLVGIDATVERLRSAEGSHRYLHFATHGFQLDTTGPNRRPGESAFKATRSRLAPMTTSGILLSSGFEQGAGQPYILTALELSNMDLSPCDLVTLATCSGCTEEPGRGSHPDALATAALEAGAGAVLYSLWEVDDSVNAQFMKYFYDAIWAEEKSPDDALAIAKVQMARHGFMPRTWAAWMLRRQ